MSANLQHRPRAPRRRAGAAPVAPRWAVVALAALGAVAVTASPTLAVAATAGVVVLLVGLRSPIAVAQLGLLSLAVSPQYTLTELAPASLLVSGQKLFVLACFAPAVVRYGLRVRFLLPVVAQGLVAVAVVLLPGAFTTTATDAAAAAAGAAVGWIALSIRWPVPAARRMLVTVAVLPLVSVVIGVVFDVTGISPLFRPDPSGVVRLQGASIPAHLAAMCLAGAFAAVMLLRLGERRLALRAGATALVVVCMSLSRTDIAASVIVLVPLVLAWVRFSATTTVFGLKLWSLATAGALVLALVAPLLLARSGEHTADSQLGIDDSGRSAAWAAFYGNFEERPVIGHGPGSLEVLAEANGKARNNIFRAPHNEYLRLLVEGGVLFGTMVAVAIARTLWLARASVSPATRGPVSILLVVLALVSIVENTFVTPQFLVPLTFALGAVISVGVAGRAAPAPPEATTDTRHRPHPRLTIPESVT